MMAGGEGAKNTKPETEEGEAASGIKLEGKRGKKGVGGR